MANAKKKCNCSEGLEAIFEINTTTAAWGNIQGVIENQEDLMQKFQEEASIRAEEDTSIRADLATEASIRAEEDTSIREDLATEASIRAEEDTSIRADLATETSIRTEEFTTLSSQLATEASIRAAEDTTIRADLATEASVRAAEDTTIRADISTIQGLIPAEATTTNQLADKEYVIDKIKVYGASFRGSWDTWASVPTDPSLYPEDTDGNRIPNANDYMIVLADEQQDGGTWKYVYTGVWSTDKKSGWKVEYQIEKTPFTPEQQAAIDSGITSTLVTQISTNASDIADMTTVLASKIELTDLSSTVTGLDYNNTTGVFSLESGYVIPEQTTLNNLQRNFTFAEKGITKTTSEYSTIDLAKEVAALNLEMGITLFGEVRLNDMPTGIGNAEMKVEVQQKSGSTSVLAFTLTSTNVAPHEWTFYWVGTGTSGSPSTTEWYATVREDMVLTRTNTSSYTPTGDYNPATKKYVDDSVSSAVPSQTGNEGKYLTTDGTVTSWGTVDALPSQTGNDGKFLTTDGTIASWETVDALPSQTGNENKYLKTDGTIASWDTVPDPNNGALTISVNNTAIQTFTADQSTSVTANIIVPTKISDLTDDTSTNPIDKADTLTGLTASVTELNYTDGATSNIQTQLNGKLSPSDIINNVQSTDTDKPLSANMGKELQDQVDNLKARGRFLALWDCSTGLAETHPTVSPYLYQTGDYFIVGTVAQEGGTNYKPSGSSYTDNVPSTAVETEVVSVDDVYYYDGNVWHLQINTQKEIAFVNIAGDPYDNSNLASALNNKQDELPSQTGQSGKFLTTNGTVISWGNVDLSGYVTTNTAQDVTETKTFTTQQKLQSGQGDGCLVIGADVASNTVTANTRKLGRMVFHTNESTSLNCAFVSTDTQDAVQSGVIKNCVEFGGRPADTSLTSPDIMNFTVAKSHNATAVADKTIALSLTKDGANFAVQPKYNGVAMPTDVQIDSTSIVSGGVANIPKAAVNVFGVGKINTNYGINVQTDGTFSTVAAGEQQLINKTNSFQMIVPANLNIAIREGLGNNSLTWTDAYKTSARNTIGATQAVFVDWSDT